MAKVISDWPPQQLDHAVGQNDEDAVAVALRQMAANVLMLWGHIMAPVVLAEGTSYPPDLQSPATGAPGHAHSGGRDGRPLFRSVASLMPGNPTPYTANLVQNSAMMHFDFTLLPATNTDTYRFPLFPVWIPGCDPFDGAYVLLAVHAFAELTASTNVVVGDTLDLVITNKHPDSNGKVTLPLSSLTTTGTQNLESDGSPVPHLAMVPGALNPLEVAFVFDPNFGASSSNRTLRGRIHELELGVYRTI